MSTLFLSGIQLWQTFHVYFSVAPGLAWIPSAWWSRGLGLEYSYDLFSSHHFMGSICWWLWRWSLVRYHNFLLEWRWSMFIWWESLWPRDNMKSSYRWMAIRIHEIWLHWTCSSPRRTFFLHALSFECTSKLCITFLNQFLVYFHIEKMHYTI